ncbi:MAG: homoserine dehydrogenase [Emergencia sp.]|nr:homoserine dehydrogenase [Emergencia sp.]
MDNLKVAVLGFGDAGRAFARMLLEKNEEIRKRYGIGVVVTAISTRSRGVISDPEGIDLEKVLKDVENTGRFAPGTKGLCQLDSFGVIDKADYDVLCELTPLNIFTGQPAIDHIKRAFARGKHVVSANKGPIAWAFDELSAMAKEQSVEFFYETTVMDGTPVFNLAEHTLKFCKVTEISGILNSTTNYILEELEKGKDYDEVIAAGKQAGFIEEDPAMDIEGYDAAAKVTALLNVLMHAGITPDQVERQGIEKITLGDIRKAAQQNQVIKLLCKGVLSEDGKVRAWVKPVWVDRGEMLASIDSTTSVVTLTTDLMGKLSIVEHAPEIRQTAYGIFGDVVRVLEKTMQ